MVRPMHVRMVSVVVRVVRVVVVFVPMIRVGRLPPVWLMVPCVRLGHGLASGCSSWPVRWCRGWPPRECSAWKMASVTSWEACSFSRR